jgi:hypothetical protein
MEIREADLIRTQSHLEGITDPRRKRENLRHKLTDMPVIAPSTIIIGESDLRRWRTGGGNGKTGSEPFRNCRTGYLQAVV